MQVAALQQELHEAHMRVLIGDEAAKRQAGEVEALKNALGLKSELADLSMDGQAQLLQSLARVRAGMPTAWMK